MITSLNVVGNGFDLAHNLPTTYQDFIGRCYDRSPSLQKFKSIIESSTLYTKTSEELIVEWNDFETVIGHITNQYFYDSMEHFKIMGYSKSEEIFKKKLTVLYEIYEGIIQDFTEYLEGIPLNKVEVLPNVVPYFREEEYTVNFNYTDTVSAYQKSSLNISHVHGYLKEEEKIVLGFQPQMIRSDFEDPFSSRYNKRKLRDMLFFKRFLKEKYGNLTTDNFSKEVELYQKVIDMSDTGKGYDEKK